MKIHPMKVLVVLLMVLLLAPPAARADNVTGFEDLSFAVTITVNKDGTAHVMEEVQLAVSPAAADLYKQSLRSTRLTIDDWKRTTGSRNLRYHVLGANVTPLNTRVFPQPLQRLQFVDKSIAVIAVEYDTSAPIFLLREVGPRRTSYTLIGEALSFENAPEGQVLPENAVLAIRVPDNSRTDLSKIYPRPTYPPMPEGKEKTVSSNVYVWNATGGALPLTPFDFTFETEKSLDEEMSEYFTEMQGALTSVVFSNYGVLFAVLAAVFLLLFFALKQAKAI
jgi:hypothetical protein